MTIQTEGSKMALLGGDDKDDSGGGNSDSDSGSRELDWGTPEADTTPEQTEETLEEDNRVSRGDSGSSGSSGSSTTYDGPQGGDPDPEGTEETLEENDRVNRANDGGIDNGEPVSGVDGRGAPRDDTEPTSVEGAGDTSTDGLSDDGGELLGGGSRETTAAERLADERDGLNQEEIAEVDVMTVAQAGLDPSDIEGANSPDDKIYIPITEAQQRADGPEGGADLSGLDPRRVRRVDDNTVEIGPPPVDGPQGGANPETLDVGFVRRVDENTIEITNESALREDVASQSEQIDSEDVIIEETENGVDVRLSDDAQQELLSQTEEGLEQASVTIPDVVPGIGGREISGQVRDVEVSQTEDGTVTVDEQERFGDVDLEIPDLVPGVGGREFEDVTGSAGERVVGALQETAASTQITAGPPGTGVRVTQRPDDEQQTKADHFVGEAAVGVGNIVDQGLNLPQESLEFQAYAASEIAAGRGSEFFRDVGDAAVGKGIVTGQAAASDPVGFTGQIAGSAVFTGGALGAARALGGARAARATSVAVQPGEELGIAVGRRVPAAGRAISRTPLTGVSEGMVRGNERSFFSDNRGQMDLVPTRHEEATDTEITAEDISPRQPTTRPTVRARAEETEDVGAFTRRRSERIQRDSEADTQATSIIEGIEDPRPSPSRSERVPPGMRRRQETASEPEARIGETVLPRLEATTEAALRTEATVDTQQLLGAAQEQQIETGLRGRTTLGQETGLETGLETRLEPRQEFRFESRSETRQETRSEARQERRRETKFETGLEFDAGRRDQAPGTGGDFGVRTEVGEAQFEVPIAEPEDVVNPGASAGLDFGLGGNSDGFL